MTEHQALLEQARSDITVFAHLYARDRAEVPECHPLHYLQMATEKLAKAAFIAQGTVFDRFSHVAFSHVPYQLSRGDVARALGFKDSAAYREFLRRTAHLFRAVDELNPAVGLQTPGGGGPRDGPNVEYPWLSRDAAGQPTWVVPARHDFRLIAMFARPGEAARMLVFVRNLLDRFEVIFR